MVYHLSPHILIKKFVCRDITHTISLKDFFIFFFFFSFSSSFLSLSLNSSYLSITKAGLVPTYNSISNYTNYKKYEVININSRTNMSKVDAKLNRD